jgi:hypothetical protein
MHQIAAVNATKRCAAHRGYGEALVEADLHALGVRTVVIPTRDNPGPARIAHLKRVGGHQRPISSGRSS